MKERVIRLILFGLAGAGLVAGLAAKQLTTTDDNSKSKVLINTHDMSPPKPLLLMPAPNREYRGRTYRRRDDLSPVMYEATALSRTIAIGANGQVVKGKDAWAVFGKYPNGSVWMMNYAREQWQKDIAEGTLVEVKDK
ncbi:hypothetical protein L0Y46_04795 [bacterium]|nr:hypothetical protein [bacterium]